MRILVADDDDSIRGLLRQMLAEWGYDVTAVENGTKALQVMQAADPPMLAICDWNMPGLAGPEVIRQVRTIPCTHPPYLLLLTAKDQQTDVNEGLHAGANDYIT